MPKYLSRIRQIEVLGLYGMIFFLPFLKVPKNISLVVFILAALGVRVIYSRISWRRPDTFELLLIFFALTAAVSTILNWPFEKGISGFKDSAIIATVGLIIYSSRLSHRQIKTIAWLFLSGVTIGLSVGFYEYYIGVNPYFEFRRMMVAETSTITSIALAITIGMVLDTTSTIGFKEKIISCLLGLVFFLCLILMGNRSGLFGIMAFFFCVFLMNIKNIKFYIVIIALASLASISLALMSDKLMPRINHIFSTKIELGSTLKFNSNDSYRFQHWQLSIAQHELGEKKFFGIGPRNFKSIDIELLNKKSDSLNMQDFEHLHAHNMYLTKLAEEGLMGLLSLLLLLGFILKKLLFDYKKHGPINWETISGWGALIIPMTAGIFYSPYYRETALVSILFMTLFLYRKKTEKEPPLRKYP